MMNRDRHEQEISVNQNSKEGSRNKSITPNKRPSRARGTEAVTGNVKFVVLIHGIQMRLEEKPYVQNVVMLLLKI